ncbi:MAG: hypothetical protein JW932_03345 [Deltaproteobacteria bacterium]|nr:hypothetical protein [Deltaproteobacteria bacterium]
MKSEKKHVILGIVIGLVLAFFYFHYFAPRYEVIKMGTFPVKIDKWTGKSWRLVDNNWKGMLDIDEDWEQVDETLREALQTPVAQVDTTMALTRLRAKYPALNDISDDELLERIKVVYSKIVLSKLYLSDFLNAKIDETQIHEKGNM